MLHAKSPTFRAAKLKSFTVQVQKTQYWDREDKVSSENNGCMI